MSKEELEDKINRIIRDCDAAIASAESLSGDFKCFHESFHRGRRSALQEVLDVLYINK